MIETKWANAGLPIDWLQKDPAGAAKIVKLGLHYPTRIWNVIRWNKEHAQLEIMVHHQWKPAAPFLTRMRKTWNEWISKHDIKFTLTANGFTSRSAAVWKNLPSCATLSTEQTERVVAAAQLTPSPLAQGEKKAVLEVVTALGPSSDNCLFNGVNEMLLRTRHPWVRLIDKNGTVYNVGFFCRNAEFRSPDTFEGMPLDGKLVTPIAITEKQCEELKALIEKYKAEGKNFNFFNHNCTSFVTDILTRVGFAVNPKMSFPEVLFRFLPKGLQKIFSPLQQVVMKVWKAVSSVFSFIGRCFSSAFKKNEEKRFALEPSGFLNFTLPYKMAEWQLAQASTKQVSKNCSFLESV